VWRLKACVPGAPAKITVVVGASGAGKPAVDGPLVGQAPSLPLGRKSAALS